MSGTPIYTRDQARAAMRKSRRPDIAGQLAAQMKAHGLPEPAREFRFHASRRWRFDFAFVPQHIAVEVEGGIWTGGAHTRGAHFLSDSEKYAEAGIAGWLVLRVATNHIRNGQAIDWIRRALAVRSER